MKTLMKVPDSVSELSREKKVNDMTNYLFRLIDAQLRI